MCKSVHTCTCRLPKFNPFLFIRGLSLPSCIQASLSLSNFTWLSSQLDFLKSRPSNGLEIRPQSAFSAFRELLPSGNYSIEWYGQVWQPSADDNGLLVQHYCQQGLSHLTQTVWIQTNRALKCHYFLQRAVTPNLMGSITLWEHIRVLFSRVERPSDDTNTVAVYFWWIRKLRPFQNNWSTTMWASHMLLAIRVLKWKRWLWRSTTLAIMKTH